MKFYFPLFISFLFVSITYGQFKLDTIYMDSNWKKTDKQSSMYFRILKQLDDDSYIVKDYWKTGEVQMTGQLSELYPETKEGEFVWYSKNRKISQKINYKNDDIVGTIKLYDVNGKLEIEYVSVIDSLDNAKAINDVISDFNDFIIKKLKYPKRSIIENKQGQVKVNFYIDKSGLPYKMKVTKSVNEEIDNEALRVISLFKWPIPIYRGEKTMTNITVPIDFTLCK